MKKFLVFGLFALTLVALQLLGAEKILILSDTHFDNLKWHNSEEIKSRNLFRGVQNRSNVWKNEDSLGPSLLKNAAKQPADKVFLLGDNLNGYFSSPEATSEALTDYMATLERYLGKDRKYYAVIGNHEYVGVPGNPKTKDAFFDTAEKLGISTQKGNYFYRFGANLFIFWDNIGGSHNDFKFIRDAIESNADATNKFLICHLPVLPCEPGSRWLVYGRANQDERRHQLLDYLAQNHIHVLCGHVHRFTHEVYQSEKGSFTQVTFCAATGGVAWTQAPVKYAINDKVCDYMPKTNYDRLKDPEGIKTFLAEYNGKIKEVANYRAFGYGVLTIDDDNKAKIDWYLYNADQPFASFELR